MPLSDRFDSTSSSLESPPDFLEHFPVGTELKLETSAFPMPFFVRIVDYAIDSEKITASVFIDFLQNDDLREYCRTRNKYFFPNACKLIIASDAIGWQIVLVGIDPLNSKNLRSYPVATVSRVEGNLHIPVAWFVQRTSDLLSWWTSPDLLDTTPAWV
jgi:hypothetical protein